MHILFIERIIFWRESSSFPYPLTPFKTLCKMVSSTHFLSSLLILSLSFTSIFASPSNLHDADTFRREVVPRSFNQTALATCKSIASNISSDSDVYYFGAIQYSQLIKHYMVSRKAGRGKE